MGVARYVNMAFVAVGLLAWVISAEFFTWLFGLVGPGINRPLIGVNFRVADLSGLVVAIVLTVYLRRHERVSTFSMEVGNELAKVTWPSWSETRLSTIVVIVVTFIIAMILGLFDYVWAFLSGLVYEV
ncbi:MAG: preprotein translocase subunit SecE [Myxococcota bacterium]